MIGKIALLAAVSLAWAAGYLFVSDAAHKVPAVIASAAMTSVAAVVLTVAMVAMRRPMLGLLRHRAWVPLIMAFTAIALPNLSVVIGEQSVDADFASTLGSTVPIVTLFLTTFVTRQTAFSALHFMGAAVALAGLIIFIGWSNLFNDSSTLHGVATIMAGGVVFALNGIFASYQSKDLDMYVLTTWTMIFAAIALTALAFLVDDPLATTFTLRNTWPLVAEGMIGMGLAYLGYYVLVGRGGAAFASLFAFLVPPFGVIMAAIAFGEPLTLRHFVGLGAVLLGLALMLRVGEAASPGLEGQAKASEVGRRASTSKA